MIDFLPYQDIDGLIGWPALQGRLWRIQWDDLSLSRIYSAPKETLLWKAFNIDSKILIAAAFIQGDEGGRTYLDTGSNGGISLPEPRWRRWLKEEPCLPATLTSGYNPAAGGVFATELRWSNSFQFGPLAISRVMIEKNVFQWPELETVFGLEALKHFDVVLDLIKNKLYMKERPYSRTNYEYNRLGATFPPESLESSELVGQVLKAGPAYRAGLRSGDILLMVDDIDMTQWKPNPSIMKKDFWSAPAGTQYKLQIERNGRKKIFTVILEDILGF